MRDGDVVRYVLRRAYHRNNRPSARIVQVHWPYEADHPRVLLMELAKPENTWRITERREAPMHPVRFNRLIRNVAAAVSVVGDRPDRGAVHVCSHADSSRLELSLPAQQLWFMRTAHCSDDAPAVVAGELLAAAVELNLDLDWSPPD